jgi:hypothetical protein
MATDLPMTGGDTIFAMSMITNIQYLVWTVPYIISVSYPFMDINLTHIVDKTA